MYKIIACDMDDTLLDINHKISPQNKEAILKAKELGVKFVPATGRNHLSISNVLEELELQDEEEQYVISINGSAITENKGHKMLYFQGMEFETAKELLKRGKAYNVGVFIFTKDRIFIYNLSEEEKKHVSLVLDIQSLPGDDLDSFRGETFVKLVFSSTDFQFLKKIENQLMEDMHDKIVCSYSSYSVYQYLELNQKGVSKGNALLKLAEILGVKQEETIAIGDNYNDLSMIQMAGLGVGVKNTVEDMKQYCDYITEATNDESAVAEVIEKYILMEK